MRALKTKFTGLRGVLLAAMFFLLCVVTPCWGQGQIFVRDYAGGFGPTTNSLTPVPNTGLLSIRYDFLSIPDTLDVFYGTQHIFSSGLTNGNGLWVIPYGPGLADNLDIVVNMNGDLSGSVWMFTTSIAVPEPGTLSLLGLGALALIVWRGQKRRPVH